MKSGQLFLSLIVGGLFFSTPLATPLARHTTQDLFQVTKRQESTIAITGVNDGIYTRKEIRTLQQQYPDQYNLFLLALTRMKATNENDKLSWYQVAGIHGLPKISWDGVAITQSNGRGYCTHSSNLFPTWHRPYMALYEQILYSHVQEIVNEFPEGPQKSAAAAAADTFRIPHWDWALSSDGSSMPAALTQETVQVTMPNGTTTTIENPLYRFTFHPQPADSVMQPDYSTHWSTYKLFPSTMRYPTSKQPDAVSQNDRARAALDANLGVTRKRLYDLFTNYRNYSVFSNDQWWKDTPVGQYDSIEAIHDSIHDFIGGNIPGTNRGTPGHMGNPLYAAFDPVFLLHHANVDRLFAMWQALYPEEYVQPEAAPSTTSTIAEGSIQDAASPLEPFHSDTNGGFWTSNSIRDHTVFGYTYDDLSGNVRNNINNLYGNKAIGSTTGTSHRTRSYPRHNRLHERASLDLAGDTTYQEWIVNIRSEKFALDGSYNVYISLGDFSDEPTTWVTDVNTVGVYTVFAMGMKSDGGLLVSGVIPLTPTLHTKIQSGELEGPELDTVTAYLKQNLQWRVTNSDGSAVPCDQVAGLVVSVVSCDVEPAADENSFPIWSNNWVEHPEITD